MEYPSSMNEVREVLDLETLEALWDEEILCEIDHEEVSESSRVTLPGCDVIAAAKVIDCAGDYFVCRALGLFLERNIRIAGVTCVKHGSRCIEIKWL